MEQPKIYVSFFLDASRPNIIGKCLVKLNIYQKPDKRRYKTEFHLSKEEWEKLNAAKLRDDDLKEVKKKMSALKIRAEKIIEKLEPFSFAAFEEAFYAKTKERKSTLLITWFKEYVQQLKNNEQIGTAISYNTTINSLNQFKANLQVQDITTKFLEQYESYMLSLGKSPSTVGIYLRQLRCIINLAIKDGIISRDNYPFKDYQIPTSRNVKKAMKESQVATLLSYDTQEDDKERALDFWILSYLCNGMNFADIIKLKPENINGQFIYFIREKTKRTKKKDIRPIKVALNAIAVEIIERRKNTNPENPYLFPILEACLSATTIKYRCQRFIKWVNKRMYLICAELGVDHKASTYAARHTFSTILKRKGAPTSYIKDCLGHSTESITESYLDSFEDDVALEYADVLTNFTKPALKVV